MIDISKDSPPESLSQYKREMVRKYSRELKGKNIFDDYPDKKTLRDQLAEEQGYLCAYCMSRINTEPLETKIDHLQSKNEFPEKKLDYSNLLICCLGNEGEKGMNQHCDTRKGSHSLSFNPSDTDKSIQNLIKYKYDGTIYSVQSDIDWEMNEKLNLNFYRLKKNRESVRIAINKHLNRKIGTRSIREVSSFINGYRQKNTKGQFKPFCGVVLYWLNKHQSLHK